MQTDRPINTAAEDRFDRAPFARRVADVIRQRKDQATLVVGIYGPWGDGKSSTLSLIKEALAVKGDVVQVDYNPWFFSTSTENLIRSFFLTLGDTLQKTKLFSREKVGKLLKKYGGLVPKFGDVLKTAGDALSVVELKAIRSQLEEILKRHKTPIVVFVDDIDRLDRDEIQTLFKLIRLSADFPYVTYVLAFDDGVVSSALAGAYEDGGRAAGRRFVEKIIQVPLHLPSANPEALRKMMFAGVDAVLKANGIDLAEADVYAFANNFSLCFTPLMVTPRQAKLYENALAFAVPNLVGEVNIVDLLLLEAIRSFVPTLYLAIRSNPPLFLKSYHDSHGNENPLDAVLAAAFAKTEISEKNRDVICGNVLERLFPRVSQMDYGDDWDRIWAGEKKVCVNEYFSRYFSYGVPTGDVADSMIDQLLLSAIAGDSKALNDLLTIVAAQSAYPAFIRKLRVREKGVPAQAVLPLINAIALAAQSLPREPGNLISDWTIVQAAILTSHLAENFGEQIERFNAIQVAIRESTSHIYSVELLRWSRSYEEKGETRGFLDEAQIAQLTLAIISKLLVAAGDTSLYQYLGDDTATVLLPWSWFGDQEALRENIEASVKADGPDGAEMLIKVCCGKSWEMQTGIPSISDVSKNVYDTVIRFADPELVLDTLRTRYGKKLDAPEFYVDRTTPLGERLAIQFAHIHLRKAHSGSTEIDGEQDGD